MYLRRSPFRDKLSLGSAHSLYGFPRVAVMGPSRGPRETRRVDISSTVCYDRQTPGTEDGELWGGVSAGLSQRTTLIDGIPRPNRSAPGARPVRTDRILLSLTHSRPRRQMNEKRTRSWYTSDLVFFSLFRSPYLNSTSRSLQQLSPSNTRCKSIAFRDVYSAGIRARTGAVA